MALPSSGPLSFSDIRTEFVNGACLEAGSEYSLSAFALAQNSFYSYGSLVNTSQFYGAGCPGGKK